MNEIIDQLSVDFVRPKAVSDTPSVKPFVLTLLLLNPLRQRTVPIRIAGITGRTRAQRPAVARLAPGVDATGAGAGVAALEL